ncbi:hypothetical protein ACPC54_18325 [Kitasatospora sp. NPDC094028]
MELKTLPLATEAAAALDGWTVGESGGSNAWLHHPDGRIVKIGQGKGRPLRLEAIGILPAGSSQDTPVITVAAARGGAALADEIHRRLLPAYSKALDLAWAELAEGARLASQYEQLRRRLSAPLPTANPDSTDPKAFRWKAGPRDFGRPPGTGDTCTDAAVSIANSTFEVDIKLRWLPAEVAAQILDLLGTAAATHWTPTSGIPSRSNPHREQPRRRSRRERRLRRRGQRGEAGRREPVAAGGSGTRTHGTAFD